LIQAFLLRWRQYEAIFASLYNDGLVRGQSQSTDEIIWDCECTVIGYLKSNGFRVHAHRLSTVVETETSNSIIAQGQCSVKT